MSYLLIMTNFSCILFIVLKTSNLILIIRHNKAFEFRIFVMLNSSINLARLFLISLPTCIIIYMKVHTIFKFSYGRLLNYMLLLPSFVTIYHSKVSLYNCVSPYILATSSYPIFFVITKGHFPIYKFTVES